MLSIFLPAPVIGALSFVAFIASTIFWGGLIVVVPGVIKFLVPVPAVRRACGRFGLLLGSNWTSTNALFYRLLHPAAWQVDFRPADFDPRKSYLIVSNHQSWADILILFDLFHGRLPFPRFFMKRELLFVPIVGMGCWALDFPFMKRHSREAIEKTPALRHEDLETTRRTCEIYKERPMALVNFLEGTRFTEAKRAAKQSPYRHLLRPKSAGLSFTLNAMGEQFGGIIDVTLAYQSTTKPLLWSWLCGEQDNVQIHVDLLPIPPDMIHGDYDADAEFRARFQTWVNGIWSRKDARLEAMQSRPPVGAQRPAHY